MTANDINLRSVDLAEYLDREFARYALYVVMDRAIPDAADGLKPVHRRILYAMREMGLHAQGPTRKSARIVGEVLGKFHPHGDAAVYEAMVRMAQDFSMRVPLVYGQGNFGSIDGDPAAAMRYTEARLTPAAEALLADIDEETVEFGENFDASQSEPVVLPARWPNLLVNGTTGIAVGISTDIPPHNLGEVCDGLIYLARNWKKRSSLSVEALMEFIPGPDLPTGGLLYKYGQAETGDAILEAYRTGKGSLTVRARADIQDAGGGRSEIIITEIPYTVSKADEVARIGELVRAGKLAGIGEVRDESSRAGLRIVIEVSRGHDPQAILGDILANTRLQLNLRFDAKALTPANGAALRHAQDAAGSARLSLLDILTYFIQHRLAVIERRSRFRLRKAEARRHLVAGLLVATHWDNLDAVIATIRASRSAATARQKLQQQFKLSQLQAQAVLDMRLARLVGLERRKLEAERQQLDQTIKALQELLASEAKRLAVVVAETEEIKRKFADPRRTVIVDHPAGAASGITVAGLERPGGPQIVVLTTHGVQRHEAQGYSYQVKAGLTARPVEAHLLELRAEADDEVILVSSRGRVWRAPVGRIPAGANFAELGLDRNSSRGLAARGEILVGAGIAAPDHYLVLGTQAGNIKRTGIADLAGGQANWSIGIGLAGQDDRLLLAGVMPDQAEVMFFTAKGKAIRFAARPVKPQATPSARGVTGIKLGRGDRLVAGAVFVPGEGAQVIIASQTGFIKRVSLAEFPLQGRAGQGVQSLAITRATGPVVAATVTNGTAVDLLSAQGRRQRLAMTEIPETGRRKRGAQLAGFGPDDPIVKVVAF
jgi:DNA gyrase subunit A